LFSHSINAQKKTVKESKIATTTISDAKLESLRKEILEEIDKKDFTAQLTTNFLVIMLSWDFKNLKPIT
jgi:hypothetical protein